MQQQRRREQDFFFNFRCRYGRTLDHAKGGLTGAFKALKGSVNCGDCASALSIFGLPTTVQVA